MPPKKRALEESSSDAQGPPSKRSSTGKASADDKGKEQQPATENHEERPKEDLKDKSDDEYICMNRAYFDIVAELREQNDEADEEEIEEMAHEKRASESMWPKPAAKHQDWKWVIMWEAWKMLCELHVKKTHVNPDCFDMYVYNDSYGYGLKSLIERTMADFAKEMAKKDKRSLQHLWAIMSSLAHWLSVPDVLSAFLAIDDAEGVEECMSLVGGAFLSVLEVMDLEGQLKPDSKYHDVGLVMSLHLDWSRGMPDYGFEGDALVWRQSVVAYATKAGIDLTTTGCHSVAETLKENELQAVEPIQGPPKADRWKWTKKFAEYRRNHGIRGGVMYGGPCPHDITQWSRGERARYNFENVDPLAAFPDKEIKAGNIMLASA